MQPSNISLQTPEPIQSDANRWYLRVALLFLGLAAVGFYVRRWDFSLPYHPSAKVVKGFALSGGMLLLADAFRRWQIGWRRAAYGVAALLLILTVGLSFRTFFRYRVADRMEVPVQEYSNAAYPEDPANRSVHHGKYHGRSLTLVKKDDTHFDFILEPKHPHIARIVFRNVDVSLMTPSLPAWTQSDPGLRRIALTDRQWNRQQVRFGGPGSENVEITGGDGFELSHLYSAELAKNCLNAGLWEVLLFTKDTEAGDKTLYYQNWFTFPLGHYKALFERNTTLPYWQHGYYLEHWFDPEGAPIPMEKLRQVKWERSIPTDFNETEPVLAFGEQARKRKTTMAQNVVAFGDFYDGRKVRFASFIPPGRYSVKHPWRNKYGRIDRFDKAILREITSPATDAPLHELEMIFEGSKRGEKLRLFVSGFDLAALPQLPVNQYSQGMYMPMGIGVPPFFQSYEALQKNPPHKSPYVSVMLDEEGGWIDHHTLAIDGPVLHRDMDDPTLLHVYLLSYERHSLIAHLRIPTDTVTLSADSSS